jgi:alkylated DNA repair dioxygenase AlkB
MATSASAAVSLPSTVRYVGNFVSLETANSWLEIFKKQLRWETKPREGRPTALYGDETIESHHYARNNTKPIPWSSAPEALLLARKQVQEHTGHTFDLCLCNAYPTGLDRFKKHADREEIGNPVPIAVISLGAERMFEFFPQSHLTDKRCYQLVLQHGSLLVMESKTHTDYLHQLPAAPNNIDWRISLTFRKSQSSLTTIELPDQKLGSIKQVDFEKKTLVKKTDKDPEAKQATLSQFGFSTSNTSNTSSTSTAATSNVSAKSHQVTTVVNIHHRDAGYTVNIMRPSKWGNPYPIVTVGPIGERRSRAEVIALYRKWIVQQPDLLRDLHELKGQVLGCCCKPLSCHGDILAELANAQ